MVVNERGCEIVFGYGSLMSAKGLLRKTPVPKIRDAYPLWMDAERGFAKPAGRLRLAMDLDFFYPLEGRRVPPFFVPKSGFVGLALEIVREDFPNLCSREGYPCDLGEELIKKARNHPSVGDYLWSLFEEEGVDSLESVKRYRRRLAFEVGSSRDYLPHPLKLEDGRVAIVFIAPGRHGTGSNLLSVKEYHRIFELRNSDEAAQWLRSHGWDLKEFKSYLLECVLGSLHGVCVRDIMPEAPEKDSYLYNELRTSFLLEIVKERSDFIGLVFGSERAYEERFGRLSRENLVRMGIPEDFLQRELVVKRAPRVLDFYEDENVPVAVTKSALAHNIFSIKSESGSISPTFFSIEDEGMSEYKRSNPRFASKVKDGDYILINRVARERLGVEVDERVSLFLA